MNVLEEKKFKKKYQKMKRIIKDLVFENAALCDQVAHMEERVLILREERKFLLKKLYNFQDLAAADMQLQYQTNVQNAHTGPEPAPGKKTVPRKRRANVQPHAPAKTVKKLQPKTEGAHSRSPHKASGPMYPATGFHTWGPSVSTG